MTYNIRLSTTECADLIAAAGHTNRFLLRGEKGLGKSSIMSLLREKLGPDYEYIYLDTGAMSDIADIHVPFPDREEGITRFMPTEKLKLHTGKKIVLMLDELTKANRMVLATLHPALEIHKPRLGDYFLPEGSIVFATGNLSEEGIGDNLLAHTGDRITEVEVRKPTPDEWLAWGMQNNVNPAVLAWVRENPETLASFRDPDFSDDNPYVYNPRKVQKHFLSPRGLELMSNLVWQRDRFSAAALEAALAGTGGEAAAKSLANYIRFQDELPPLQMILDEPKTAPIPTNIGALITLAFNLERRVDVDTIDAVMTYVDRMPLEQQSMFCLSLARNKVKNVIAFRNAKFTQWAQRNQDIL